MNHTGYQVYHLRRGKRRGECHKGGEEERHVHTDSSLVTIRSEERNCSRKKVSEADKYNWRWYLVYETARTPKLDKKARLIVSSLCGVVSYALLSRIYQQALIPHSFNNVFGPYSARSNSRKLNGNGKSLNALG